jgi:hypothetical protein
VATTPQQIFIVPGLEGTPTGGTVFNRCLVEALSPLPMVAQCCTLDAVFGAEQSSDTSWYWLDTLYLQQAPLLRTIVGRPRQLGLLVHYLPSLLTWGERLTPEKLSSQERFALETCDAFLVTSRFMHQTLLRTGVQGDRIVVVEPGQHATGPVRSPADTATVAAVMVANLLPNKGVLPFLQELVRNMTARDEFTLHMLPR